MIYTQSMIYLAADHRGFALKQALKDFLVAQGHPMEDVGAFAYDKDDDYVDFAARASVKIVGDLAAHKGIFICGSGHGVAMAADKFKGIRAAIGFNKDVARQSRAHEDANVLVLPSDWIDENMAREIVTVWLDEPFAGAERHVRRLKKVEDIEERNFSAESGSASSGK